MGPLAGLAYRIGLWLYPPEFRRAVGPELRREFRRGLARRRRRSACHASAWVARELLDLLGSAVREWREPSAPRAAGRPTAWRGETVDPVEPSSRMRRPEDTGPARRHRHAPGGAGTPPSPLPPPRSPRPRNTMRPLSLDRLRQDLRTGLRAAARTPMTTAAIVVTLAVGIGANAAVFGVIDGVLLEPLAYPESGRLVYMNESYRETETKSVSYLNWLDWRRRNRSFAGLGARTFWSFTLTGEGPAARLEAMLLSADLDDVLGLEPPVGRFFSGEEVEGEERVLLLSHGLWRTRFGGDPEIVGRSLTLDDAPWTVIGVMPAGLEFPLAGTDVYAPITVLSENDRSSRGSHPGIAAIGRLREGTTLEAARRDMDRVARELADEYPDTNQEAGVNLSALHERQVGRARPLLFLMMGAVVLVLAAGCANVANLMLVRAAGRTREAALRTALGASRGRIVQQLVTESLVLAGLGCLAGLLVARACMAALPALAAGDIPRLDRVGIDGTVLGFAALVSLAAGLVFGLVPALRVSGTDPARNLRESGSGTRVAGGGRLRGALVVTEVALALVLMVGAALMLRSVTNLLAADPGVDTRGVLTAYVPLGQEEYPATGDRARFYDRLLERLQGLPGVEATAGGDPLPLSGYDRQWSISPDGVANVDDGGLRTDHANVTPGYFELLGIPVLAGSTFTGRETPDRLVAVIDETLAARLFPDQQAVGRRLRFRGEDTPWMTVIGVVRHVKNYGVDAGSREQIYLPHTQNVWGLNVLVKTTGDPGALVPALRAAVAGLDPDLAVSRIGTMADLEASTIAEETLATRALLAFGGVALGMALLGLYGVVSYSVSLRTREIGLRRALGARGPTVTVVVVRDALTLAGLGLALGLAAALALSRLLSGLLFEVEPTDPLVLAATVAATGLAALLAALVPARRAAGVSPTVALRQG